MHSPRRAARLIRRRLSSRDTIWRHALSSEVAFWAEYIETRGREHPEEFERRVDPQAPIEDPLILDALKPMGSSHVRIIDVGAGPLTSVGFRDPAHPTRHVEVVAVDPLADDYNALLDAAGISPPVRTIRCRGEDLVETFGADSFDIGYARNALDHTADPITAIENLVQAVRPGGVIALLHTAREAENQRGEGLHQWNFDIQDGRLVVYGKRGRYDLAEHFDRQVRITAKVYSAPHASWIAATILRDDAAGDGDT